MELSVCVTHDDYETWRAIRIADRAETAGCAFGAPRVRPESRRLGVGSALLRALAEHCSGLGLPVLRASVDDEGALAFADRFGFVEVDREVEQVRAVGDEEPASALPAGVEVVSLSQHPERWAACFETFGKEALADFAVHTPLEISAQQWNTSWRGDPMFLALYEGEVIGCAGLDRDTDRPERGEKGARSECSLLHQRPKSASTFASRSNRENVPASAISCAA